MVRYRASREIFYSLGLFYSQLIPTEIYSNNKKPPSLRGSEVFGNEMPEMQV